MEGDAGFEDNLKKLQEHVKRHLKHIRVENITSKLLDDGLDEIKGAKKLVTDKAFETKSGKKICGLLDKYEKDEDKQKHQEEIEACVEKLHTLNESTSLIICKVVTEFSKKGSSELVSSYMRQLWQSLSDATISRHTDGPKFLAIKYFVMVEKKIEIAFIKELVGILERYRELRLFRITTP